MDGSNEIPIGSAANDVENTSGAGVYALHRPDRHTAPIVVASPHSGDAYPAGFVTSSRLSQQALRRSEDCHVSRLLSGAVDLGLPLLEALFPRAYVDVNREPFELDQHMFHDPLPDYVTTRSPRISAGLGTIARVVANGQDIYAQKLSFVEALERIQRCYHPYHAALKELIRDTRKRFGYCILIDGHSMPSSSVASDYLTSDVDIVLGDYHGRSCDRQVIEAAEQALRHMGYAVARNDPYAGGYVTRHYGRPENGSHVLQLEVNRSLYMDERSFELLPYAETLAADLAGVLRAIAENCRLQPV